LVLHYKNELINDVQRNARRMFWEPCETHKYAVWAKYRYFKL
jgi:hypothetical protein